MNLTALLVAGALALAAPVGYATYDHLSAGDSGDPVAGDTLATLAVQPGLLQLRIVHAGQSLDAVIWVYPVGAERNEDALVATLVDGENLWNFKLDPAVEYEVEFITNAASYEPIGIFDASLMGQDTVKFTECDSIDYLIQTIARDGTTGMTLFGAECIPGPQRFVSVEASGATVALPYPTCPLDCGMEFSRGGAGRLEFEVPEGAQKIDVIARWDPMTPMTETLDVWLTTPDASCGEKCWMGVAGQEGAREVRFTYDAPEPGKYGVSTHLTMPAGASPSQDVWLEAVVHLS